jgi:hypothetical protein
MFGYFMGAKETPVWKPHAHERFESRFCSFSRTDDFSDDVLDTISQMIKSVDSVQGSTSAGFTLPEMGPRSPYLPRRRAGNNRHVIRRGWCCIADGRRRDCSSAHYSHPQDH